MENVGKFYRNNKEDILLFTLVTGTVISTLSAIQGSVVGFVSAVACAIAAYKLS